MKRIALSVNTVLLWAFVLITFRLDSQEPTFVEYIRNSPWEEIYLHIDRDKYIAGEDLWFSIYTFDTKTGKLSDRSIIAYVELLNPWNVPLIKTRLKLSGGRGEGSFLLPDSISSGTYTIRAYTNWMKNFLPDICFTEDIDIYNPFINSGFRRKAAPVKNLQIKETVARQEKGSIVTLAADSLFGRREKVTLKLETGNYYSGQSGIRDMSISVTPAEISGVSEGMEEYMLNGNRRWENILSGIKTPPQYSFESNGHFLTVIIKYRENNIPDSSDFVYMSIQGKVAEFDYAQRDSLGRFSFILPVDSRSRNLILQPEDANNNMILEIEPSFSRILPARGCFEDTITGSLLKLFSDLSFNYQAEKIYGISSRKAARMTDNNNLKKRRFYGIPEMEIKLDDYIKLPSMQEVFFELLPGINFISKKSGYEILIINPMTGSYYEEPPLVMIDGVIINDLKVLADLDPELVEKIEAIKTPYLFGNLILHGIVNVITRSGDFSDITMPEYAVLLPYRVVDNADTFSGPDYSDEKKRLSRIPDLRNTLYWNPSVKTDSNGKAEIEFWTSDIPGNYTINIQGVSQTGELTSLQRSFTVR